MEVTNCFAVQHSDKADEVFLDKKFQQTMSDLHFRGKKKECAGRSKVGRLLKGWPGRGESIANKKGPVAAREQERARACSVCGAS